MAEKYLKVGTTGLPTEQEATDVSTGAPDAGKIPALDAAGVLDPSLFPPGFGSNVSVVPASEALAAGDWVNLFDNAGAVNARKADNSNARRAHGFVRAAVLLAGNASVYGPGELNDQISGLTLGAEYFLGTVGAETTVVPTAAASIVQPLGVAESATAIRFHTGAIIVRAP